MERVLSGPHGAVPEDEINLRLFYRSVRLGGADSSLSPPELSHSPDQRQSQSNPILSHH